MSGDGNQDELSLQIANLLKHGVNPQPKSPKLSDSLQINLKLNSQNYALWTRMIRVAIGGKSKNLLKHLTSNPPKQDDETYEQWEQDDLVVFSWLIQNIEPVLAGNLTEFPTAKSLWDALVVTYSSGRDKLQTFNLHVKANEIKQNDKSLEDFWIILQGVWGEIDRIDPNPMKCPEDIRTYLRIRSEQKLFQFLNALDRKYDPIKREILRLDPLPSAEAAYATVRKEAAHQNILGTTVDDTQGIAAGLSATGTEGLGLVTKGHRRFDGKKNGAPNKEDKTHLKCDHCGMTRHTKAQCFKIVGYPDWWSDGHKKSKTTGPEKGTAAAAIGDQEGAAREGRNPTGFGGVAAAAIGETDDVFSVTTGTGVERKVSIPHSYLETTFTLTPEELEILKATSVVPFMIESFIKCNKHPNFSGFANMAQNLIKEKEQSWIFDCGATDTMTYEKSDFVTSTKPTKSYIHTANGETMSVKNGGTIEISPTLKISNCLYVPSFSHKLLSISHVTKELNCSVLMQPTFCILQDIRTGAIIGRGTERGGLYYVDEVTQSGTVLLSHGTVEREAWLWHRRLGHPSTGYLHILFPKLFPSNCKTHCETCMLAKSHRKTFKPNNTRVDEPFSLIHSDVWGPAPVIGGQHLRFFVIFVDDCTRMTWVYLLKNKSEVLDKFTIFYTMIQTQFQKNIQVFRSDNGGEFVNTSMKHFFQTKGIIHQTTCPHTPEQNGVAERKNRILLEITRALLIESQVPKVFWPEALVTATYLINRLPTQVLKLKTPLQVLSEFKKPPSNLTLEPRIFGCTAFVHIPKTNRTKLDPCAEKCVFVGYGMNQKGYRCYNPTTRHMFTTMNCDFLETKYYYTSQHSGQGERECQDTLSWLKYVPYEEAVSHSTNDEAPFSTENPNISAAPEVAPNLVPEVSNTHPCSVHDSTEIRENTTNETVEQMSSSTQGDTSPMEQNEHEQEDHSPQEDTQGGYVLPPRSNRGVPPKRYSPEKKSQGCRYPVANIAKGNLSEEAKAFSSSLYSEEIPTNTEQALKSRHWKKAMEEEMKALTKNNTWEKCALLVGKKTVGCRWVFTIKYKPDGTIERYKARLVAKGYTQTYGIDYSETFSPVAKINTIRVLFSVAANKGWPLHQFDVKNAFLHGELKEEVYMEAPHGFTVNFGEREVCRLKKSLYGLKQSPRAWFGRFTLAMKNYGFKQSNSDHTLFLKQRNNLITCLIIYVDDMIITGNDKEEITKLKKNLFTEFEMKDLGRLKYFLGIEVLRSKQGIFMCQKKYVLDLLAETGLIDCKPADTPMIANQKLYIEETAEPADRERYQRIVGKLIYLSHTRPDIAYAVGVISQFMHQPQSAHMDAVFRILRYLKGTVGHGVLFKPNGHLGTQLYTDADWAGDKGNRRSTSGYFTLVGGNLVTWRSKKQKVVALSSAEAEFRGIAKGITEVLWVRRLLTEIGFPPQETSKITTDNKAAIQISENPVQHDRTKHIEVDRHFIKEKFEAEIVSLSFVPSEEQLADILTKAVNERILHKCLDKLNFGNPTIQLEGEC
ncbi:putative RNA-directed DNA polymerase [Helianthus annuus]|uniref:Putative ribonuclease H-like domain-containing protein n=1 Tax=Helianthus annuus TaxID=4232 RepID=A0A251RP61_HELAN|nr:putative RNA-directed DNA polymerase [Helianthus annuus]